MGGREDVRNPAASRGAGGSGACGSRVLLSSEHPAAPIEDHVRGSCGMREVSFLSLLPQPDGAVHGPACSHPFQVERVAIGTLACRSPAV